MSRLASGAEYLFQAADPNQLGLWLEKINGPSSEKINGPSSEKINEPSSASPPTYNDAMME